METSDRHPTGPAASSGPWTRRFRRGWIVEIIVMVVLYKLYDRGRDWATGSRLASYHNAVGMMRLEDRLGIDFELGFQRFFLRYHPWVSFWNIYYGTVHFVMPALALVVLYRRAPERYRRWRNAWLFLLALGVAGFAIYPLMPPRLMPPRYGYVDTQSAYFNFGPQQPVTYRADGEPSAASVRAFGNLYSGLPSLHVGWATFSVLALLPFVRRRILRVLLLLDIPATLVAIYMTGNHRVLDALAGFAAVGLALAAARSIEHVWALIGRYQMRTLASREPARALATGEP